MGTQPYLDVPWPRPTPKTPPDARAYSPSHGVESGALRVLERVQERGQPLQPVGRGDSASSSTAPPTTASTQDEVAQRHADHPQQAEQDQHEAQRGAEVGLEHHQRGERREAGNQRQEQVPGPAQRRQLLLAGEQVGAPEQHRELAELRRLHLQRAEVDPAAGTVGGDPDARNQHRDQRGERERRATG